MDEFIVNQHIMEICKQRNLSIYRLAKMSDMPYSSLNNMIKHRHVPTIYNLMKICNGLNISLSQFFAGIEDNVDNKRVCDYFCKINFSMIKYLVLFGQISKIQLICLFVI